jgi:UDP-N-acetylmuramyl tripeptide synthase
MKLLDSRRLTGPNLYSDSEGAVLDVELAPEEAEAVVPAWEGQVRRMLAAVGWEGAEVVARRFAGGASLFFSAPLDCLYAATEVNEWAWAAAETLVGGTGGPPDPAEAAAWLRVEIERESNPALMALRAPAAERGVSLLYGEGFATVGLGAGSVTWPAGAIPHPAAIDWGAVRDVPVALVTGTNGKTTTVRLLAAIARAAGCVAGTTSTDRVEVGGEAIDEGDFSGPGGARALLRDQRVNLAILETARGGLLRRGLAVRSTQAALVTNIAADHLGEFGVNDLPALAEAKLVVARGVKPGGRVVLNADDPLLAERAGGLAALGHSVVWFGLDPANPVLRHAIEAGGEAAVLEGDELVVWSGGRRRVLTRVGDVPIAFGGAARHNVANALGAAALAAVLGLPDEAIAGGLGNVGGTPRDNPGRANLFEVNGVRVLVDYAHNPHGVEALLGFAATLPAARRLILVGQAGDRDDAALRDLARSVWAFRPDHVVVKELPELLRGRSPGETSAILKDEFRRLGAAPEALTHANSELEGVQKALAWARPGDLLVLLVHAQRDEVLALLR